MERKEAEKLVDKLIIARVLVNITNSVLEEVINELQKNPSQGICEDVLDQIDIRHTSEDLAENQANYEVFKDTIFEAIQKSFTINQLKLLEKSNQDSRNYHLMYAQLKEYFAEKVNSALQDKNDLFLASIYSDKTYLVIFRQMAEFTSEFGESLLSKKNAIGKNIIEEDKISDEFVK